MLPLEVLQKRIANSELGREWINDPLINKDIWLLEELGYSQEECKINAHTNIYFNNFSLLWLKLLTKLTVKTAVKEKHSISRAIDLANTLRKLDKFLLEKGYYQPYLLTDTILWEFIGQFTNIDGYQSCIKYAVNLWKSDSNFDKLFCKISASRNDGVTGGGRSGGRFTLKPIYLSQVITHKIISKWLEDFSYLADLRDKDGNKLKLTSHMFRRTKASIMAYCEAEDEYIAAVLGHSSLDMLPHYRKRSLERLEKEADTKGYVDMYGRVTDFKPKKRRYERLAELLKVSTPLGECHRPTMLGDCQYRYACLSCDHHRVMLEDKPKIEADLESLEKDLEQAKATEKERRVTEINRLLDLLQTRLQGLKKLQHIKGKKS